MNEYIEKAAILSKCEEMWNNADETTQTGVDTINAIDMITDFIEAMKAADVQPVKCGRWIFTEKLILGNPYGSYKCSECMYHVPHEDNYCPNCGARMDLGDEKT